MTPLLAGKVWTYWISYFIFGGTVLLVLATVVLYLVKVESKKYPKR